MKKILVPTDFSTCSNHAATVALDLARRLGAWVYFLHLSPEPSVKSIVHADVEVEVHHHEISAAKSKLDDWVRRGEAQGVTCFPILVFDNGTEKIENYCKPYAIDLIIMGSHGAKGIRKLIIGSNAQRVVKHASVPVLVVKRIPESFSINTLLFASTFRHDVAKAFNWVGNFANGLKIQLHLLHLADALNPETKETAITAMKKLASGFPGLNYALDYAITNDQFWAIRNVAEKISADLIAISANEQEGGMWASNIASSLLDQEDRPVLVVK